MTPPFMRISFLSRGTGASAVERAAYRHATRMERDTGEPTRNYAGKADELKHSEILIPQNAPAWAVQAYGEAAFADAFAQAIAAGQARSVAERAAWARLSERLWQDIERVETEQNRKPSHARLAWEAEAVLPKVLSGSGRLRLVRAWSREAFGDHGTVVDCVVRDAGNGRPRAFLMLPTRPLSSDGWGPKNRQHGRWNWIHWLRTAWTRHVTLALERECPGTAAGPQGSPR